MINSGLMSSKTAEWATPRAFFDELNKEFNFTLDPCATPENAKCKKYFTKEQNGLLQSWKGERVFCNPPYGKEIGEWVKKCAEEARGGALVVMLIPARTDTQYFHEYIYQKHETRFIKGRLKFNDCGKPAPFPSMVVIMRGQKKKAYICSPYRANTPAGVKKHKEYARQLTRWAIVHGYAPICPHLYLTEVLNDSEPAEREKGLNVGLDLLAACDVIVVGTTYGISEGMIAELQEAERLGLIFDEVYKIN